MFYNARWYDSTTGRFAQADTIVTGGVQGLDRYAYVNNNPLVYVDPSGHDPITIIVLLVLFGGSLLLSGCSTEPPEITTISNPTTSQIQDYINVANERIKHDGSSEDVRTTNKIYRNALNMATTVFQDMETRHFLLTCLMKAVQIQQREQ